MKPSKPVNPVNVAPVNEASAEWEKSSAATPESRAERLVAEYLRVWGLRDPQTIALFAKHWVEVAASDPSLKKDHSVSRLYRAVMRRAIDDMERWLEHLTGEVSRGRRYARRGRLAIELQSIIDRCPTALLDHGPMPAALRQRLAGAAMPVVPPTTRTRMPVQSLEPITLDYLSRGRQIWNRLCHRLGAVRAAEGGQSA